MRTGDPVSRALDPEILEQLSVFPEVHITADTLVEHRSGVAAILGGFELSTSIERSDHVVDCGDHEVLVRIHRPHAVTAPQPCVYSIHGGGYIVGYHAMEDPDLDRWGNMFACVGASVDYRLAPETPYPGPLEDCYAALRWVHRHADELGVDPNRIGLRGASAGGGLAAALALLARDRGEIPVAFQLLECPMIDDRQITPSSREEGLAVWSRASNEFGWRSYLGDLYGGDDVPSHAAPARATDLVGLPPTLIVVGGADGFCDEAIDYARRLNEARVSTELHVLPGAPHGVQMFGSTAIARRWQALVDDWLQRQLS